MTIYLDGRPSSLLDFRNASKQALMHIAKGEKILWQLDLGLTSQTTSLNSELTLRAQLLSVEHFMGSLYAEFHSYTKGLSLYQGDFNFDVEDLSEKLKFLILNIPDRLPLSLHFETNQTLSLEMVQKMDRSFFPRFDLFLNGEIPLFRQEKGHVGFLLPSKETGMFESVLKEYPTIRVISEAFLTSEWDGLDTLYVSSDEISSEGLRKLKGFVAAGGELIVCGQSLGLENEKRFDTQF